jgi:hypothetical protein
MRVARLFFSLSSSMSNLEGAIHEFRDFEVTLFLDIDKQINFTKIYLHRTFSSALLTNSLDSFTNLRF